MCIRDRYEDAQTFLREKENQLIIRIIETHGRSSSGFLHLDGTITECDLMEWNNIDTPLEIDGKSFHENTILPNDSRFEEQWSLLNYGQGDGFDNADIFAPRAWKVR